MAKEQLNKGPIAKLKSRNPKIEFDKLKLYFREPYEIDVEDAEGKLIMTQPSIGDIVHYGEKRYYSNLQLFTTNTTGYRLQLWEQGIDWNEMSDFSLFMALAPSADKEIYQTFLPGFDFADFGIYEKGVAGEDKPIKVLFDPVHRIEINENVYFHISQYLRTVFNIEPDEKLTKDPIMKRWFIEKDKRELRNLQIKKDQGKYEESGLLAAISGCCNHPGFKYKSSELKELGVFQFYDSVKRLQVYESTTALQKGMYSGFMDTKGIKSEDYNFMRVI